MCNKEAEGFVRVSVKKIVTLLKNGYGVKDALDVKNIRVVCGGLILCYTVLLWEN